MLWITRTYHWWCFVKTHLRTGLYCTCITITIFIVIGVKHQFSRLVMILNLYALQKISWWLWYSLISVTGRVFWLIEFGQEAHFLVDKVWIISSVLKRNRSICFWICFSCSYFSIRTAISKTGNSDIFE